MPNSVEERDRTPALSVVVPVYNERENIIPLINALQRVLPQGHMSYEIILVDDGSTDGSWHLIKDTQKPDGWLKGVSLSRNFGHQNAILAGLHYASGSAVVTMDGDLQHPPEIILEMLDCWKQGYKIVETCRVESTRTPLFKRVTSRWFYKTFSSMSGIPIPQGSSDFRLLDRKAVEAIKLMRDADLFLRGMSYWIGFPRTTLEYQANERLSGSTKFSFRKMTRFALASMFSFSVIPLRIGIWIGILTSVLAFAELAYIFVRAIQGNVVPGWASTLGVISFMFGILFILIGILGSYLGSVFETIKDRPRFLVNETRGFDLSGQNTSLASRGTCQKE